MREEILLAVAELLPPAPRPGRYRIIPCPGGKLMLGHVRPWRGYQKVLWLGGLTETEIKMPNECSANVSHPKCIELLVAYAKSKLERLSDYDDILPISVEDVWKF